MMLDAELDFVINRGIERRWSEICLLLGTAHEATDLRVRLVFTLFDLAR